MDNSSNVYVRNSSINEIFTDFTDFGYARLGVFLTTDFTDFTDFGYARLGVFLSTDFTDFTDLAMRRWFFANGWD